MLRASELFDTLSHEREEMGEEKYGTLTWLKNDTLGMALEEIIDMSNYLRYSFIKILFMAEKLGAMNVDERQGHDVPIGLTAFMSSSPRRDDADPTD